MLYPIRIIIAGGRDFNDYEAVYQGLGELIEGLDDPSDAPPYSLSDICVISGMARGADKLGIRAAEQAGLPVSKHPAIWSQYGTSAGFIRNTQMAKLGTHLLAFWDGKSRGTAHMIKEAQRRNLDVTIVRY